MKIDSGSLAFNININGKVGGTPSWGTAIVYQTDDNKIKEDIAKDILIGMIYKKIDCTSKELSLPLGKGGKIYHGDEDFNTNGAPSVPYLAAKFENTYVNGKFVGKPFILLVMKDGYDAHNGRLQLKYSPKIAWGQYKNQEFFDEVFNVLGIPFSAPLIYYSIDVLDQDKLHFRCIFKEDEYTFIDAKEYNDFLKQTINVDEQVEVDLNKTHNDNLSIQQIFYGAPGTGKSHKIKSEVDEKNKICYRTTFHPDSDYSTFVGAYKPSMKPTGTILASGEKEEIIKYTFVPQAFTKSYVHAWNTKDEVYLVIEEINRGNCAQIFGDLFQLLDRKNGFSEYPIDADSDLEDHIKEKLETSTRDDIPEQVRAGKKLMLPSNLYIWATMNTSDQSLFPIDSAFKRRWDWVYTPIKQHDEEYKIVLGDDAEYDWWGFLEKINQVIDDATSSEDKQLGYFFVKAQDKVISAEKFVGKVLFYLWNDVFKNYGFDSPIFSKGENKKFTFSDFFTGSGEPDTEMVKSFLKKLDETIDKEKPFTNDKSKVAVNPEEVAEQA